MSIINKVCQSMKKWGVNFQRFDYEVYVYTNNDTTAELNLLASLTGYNPILKFVDITNKERTYEVNNEFYVIVMG